MNRSGKWLLFNCFGLMGGFSVFAQADLQVDSFVIVKEYVPTLSQATKIRINPSIEDTFRLDLDLRYEFLDKHIPSKFTPDTIKAATLKGEPLIKLYRNYLILGYGTNAMPLGEFYFNQLRSKSSSIAVMARHHSSSGISKIENSGFSNNAVGLSANWFSPKMTYTGDLKYTYDQVHYYGYSPNVLGLNEEEAKKNEDILQFYNAFSAGITAGNNRRDTLGLKHSTDIRFDWIEDRSGTSETRIVIGQNISKIQNNEIFTFGWSLDHNDQADSKDSLSPDYSVENSIFRLEPGLELRGKKWSLEGALRFVGEFGNSSRYLFYPVAQFRFNLIKNIVVPYADISGDLQRNTYNKFRFDNPFVASGLGLINTSETFRLTAGLRGNLSKNTAFNLFFSRAAMEDFALYVKDGLATDGEYRRFGVVYDDVNMTAIGGELIYEPMNRWKVVAGGRYFIYSTTAQAEAWHKPVYRINLLTKYYLGKKIEAELLTHVIGSQKALDLASNTSSVLSGTVDVNLGIDYRYTKNTAVFLDFNNLASIRYEKWQDYPTQGFTVLGGFKFSF